MAPRRLCTWLMLACALGSLEPLIAAEPALPPTRPFHLGFTRWPADLTVEGVRMAQDFAHTHGDIVSVSIHPHMSYDVPRPIPASLLDFATQFDKPVAVAESGMTSRDVELKAFGLTLRGSEAEQRQFTELLLRVAARDRYAFVITFATTDFDRLCAKLPSPVDDLARIWAYTGLQTSDSRPKPALAVWDGWLKRAYRNVTR